MNVVNNHGYSPLLLAVLRNFSTVKTYLVANGAVMFSKTILKNEQNREKRLAEIIAVLFFGGENCEYLKSLKHSKRGRFGKDGDCSVNPVVDSGHKDEGCFGDWFERPFEYNENGSKQGIDFKVIVGFS